MPKTVFLGLGGVAPVAAALGLAAMASPAWASLGGAYATVQADRAHMAAQMASTAATTHTVHTLTLANGGRVREYANSDGVVFAVAWRGPGRPDLRQLLGPHFDTLQADNAPRLGRPARMPLAVNRSDLIVHTGGHAGAFWGHAYLPALVPPGFSAADLQ